MTFATLILKNLVRQRVRTALTVLGISLGITTVVALGVITSGLKATSAQIINFGGADFMVAQEGASDLSFSIVPRDDVASVANSPAWQQTEGVLFHIVRVGSNPFFFVFGRDPAAMRKIRRDLDRRPADRSRRNRRGAARRTRREQPRR